MRQDQNNNRREEKRSLVPSLIVGAVTVLVTLVVSAFTTEQGKELRHEVRKDLGIEKKEEGKSEEKENSWWSGSWLAPTLVVAFTIGWVLMIYAVIGNRQRDWQYGTVPFTPGQSAFTSYSSNTKTPPSQVVYPPKVRGRVR